MIRFFLFLPLTLLYNTGIIMVYLIGRYHMKKTIFTSEDFNALSREQSKQIKQHESKKFWSKIVYSKDLSQDIKYSKILERGREVEQLHNEEKWANHEMDNDFTQKNQAIVESW